MGFIALSSFFSGGVEEERGIVQAGVLLDTSHGNGLERSACGMNRSRYRVMRPTVNLGNDQWRSPARRTATDERTIA
jgi:hypothetical protein